MEELEPDKKSSEIFLTFEEAKLELPSFSKPVPEDWVTIEDHFHLVYAINVSFLDPVTLLAPEALADDGILNLVLGTIHLGRRHFLGGRGQQFAKFVYG